MTEAEGWVMARRKGAMPCLFARSVWDKMPTPERYDRIVADEREAFLRVFSK